MENKNNFKFIQGSVTVGDDIATIKFFDSVDAWSTSSFEYEFNYLTEYIKPSKIRVLINSDGGSVYHGMSTFSSILDSKIPTETINVGLAASMGSVLLAAGDVAKMKDYALIMLHNPWSRGAGSDDPMILAFTEQIKTVYKERWGFDEDKIKEIMDGPEGEDGTWINAKRAVELGIIDESNVIKTEPQEKQKVEAAINSVESKSKLATVFASLEDGTYKPSVDESSNINCEGATPQDEKIITNTNLNPMDKNFDAVVASLAMKEGTTAAEVIAKINSFSAVEAKVTEMTGQIKDLEEAKAALDIEKTGLQTSLDNVQASLVAKDAELAKANEEIAGYKEAEEAKAKAEQEAMVNAAVEAGKITAEAKDQWLKMAETHADVVKSTLESMQGTVVISKEIEEAAASAPGAKNQETQEETEAKAKVEIVVGKDFEFKQA